MFLDDAIKNFNQWVEAADKFVVEAVKKGEEAYSRLREVSNVKTLRKDDVFKVEAVLAGFNREEISVSATAEKLVVEAQHNNAEELSVLAARRVCHEVVLPYGSKPNEATASYKNGLLCILVPVDPTADEVVEIKVD